MSNKKELKRIPGSIADRIEYRMIRTGLSQPELKQHDDRFTKVTWKTKPKPRSNWYPEIPDQHIEGKK